jgi:hypothetical protein
MRRILYYYGQRLDLGVEAVFKPSFVWAAVFMRVVVCLP